MAKRKVAAARPSTSGRPTTITQTPLRLSFIEMGDYGDAKYFEKGIWRRTQRKLRNVSPKPAKQKSLHKHPEQWPDYHKAITDGAYTSKSPGEPHWWYWSGHHAWMGDGKYYADEKQWGFFNEQYYQAWQKHKWKFPGEIPGAVFMLTEGTESKIARPELNKYSNPVVRKPKHDMIGLMLIGCNTLTGVETQKMLLDVFGNKPVVFGYFQAKAPGPTRRQNAHIRAILNAPKKMKPTFFDEPELYFDSIGGAEDGLKDIIGKVSKKSRKRVIAAIYDKVLYLPEYSWKARRWRHQYGVEKMHHATGKVIKDLKIRTCPVPGRTNPFGYSGPEDRFIVSCSKPKTQLSSGLTFDELAGTAGFTKLDAFLAYAIDYTVAVIRSNQKKTITLLEVDANGTAVTFETDANEFAKKTLGPQARNTGFSLTHDAKNRFVLKR